MQVTVVETMAEGDDGSALTTALMTTDGDNLANYVGTWMIATLFRYEAVKFERQARDEVIHYDAHDEDGILVASLTLCGVNLLTQAI